MTKFCPACGEALVDDAKFCRSCGASVDVNVKRSDIVEGPLIEKSHTAAIVIGYIAAVLIPIVGLIMAIYLLTRKDSSKAKKHGLYILIVAIVVWILSFLSMSFMY